MLSRCQTLRSYFLLQNSVSRVPRLPMSSDKTPAQNVADQEVVHKKKPGFLKRFWSGKNAEEEEVEDLEAWTEQENEYFQAEEEEKRRILEKKRNKR